MKRILIAQIALMAGFVPALSHGQTRLLAGQQWQAGLQQQDSQSRQGESPATQYDVAPTYRTVQAAAQPRIQKPRPQPAAPLETKAIPPSAIETMYAGRIMDELEQFGYGMFAQDSASAATGNSIPAGAVQDDFLLSYQDELDVSFTGQRNDRGVYKVNSQGLLLIKDFPPIPAAGRTIKQVRKAVERESHGQYNTQAYVSLASVRQIGVLVVGDVKHAGRKSLTVFHTVLDALIEAGGIEKTGSLRQVKLVRAGRSTHIDLYALLMHGSTNVDMQLRDGD